MSEMSLTADHLIVIGRGRLIADTTVDGFIELAAANVVRVRTPEAQRFHELLLADQVTVSADEPDVLEVHGMSAEQIGDLAFRNSVPLHELTPQQASLEEAFMNLTRDAVEYRTEEVTA
jgi:ABC-2 type transport system ATP-binding protein